MATTKTPTSAVRVARIGGTIAQIAAAAISAHTLYHLGGQLDLGPATAWLLPAALDVYAFTAMAVSCSLPIDHPGQLSILRNARLAFGLSLGCNALDHFLQKAGRLVDPTARDLLLVSVATLPPLVVERLLNLQSLLVQHTDQPTAHREDVPPPAVPEGEVVGEATLAHDAKDRPDWSTLGGEVFPELARHLGRRPSGREFQAGLAQHVKSLVAAGALPGGTRPPSVTTAKRIRAKIEADTAHDSALPLTHS